jgi:hypothetical protein
MLGHPGLEELLRESRIAATPWSTKVDETTENGRGYYSAWSS